MRRFATLACFNLLIFATLREAICMSSVDLHLPSDEPRQGFTHVPLKQHPLVGSALDPVKSWQIGGMVVVRSVTAIGTRNKGSDPFRHAMTSFGGMAK